MKNNFKKWLSIFLAVVMLVTVIPTMPKAEVKGNVTLKSTVTEAKDEINKFHVKREITGKPYEKTKEVVFLIDNSDGMYTPIEGYNGYENYKHNFVTYVKDAIEQALDLENRDLSKLKVKVFTYAYYATDKHEKSGFYEKAKLKEIFALTTNADGDKKAFIPENKSADWNSDRNDISSAIKTAREFLTDAKKSSAIADKHIVVITNKDSNKGLNTNASALIEFLEGKNKTLADVLENSAEYGIENQIREIKENEEDLFGIYGMDFSISYKDIKDNKFYRQSINDDEIKKQYPYFYINLRNVIKTEANIAKANGINIHAVDLASGNNATLSNFLKAADTLGQPKVISDLTKVDELKAAVTEILDSQAEEDEINPIKDATLTEKIYPGFKIVPGSVKVSGTKSDYTITTKTDKYDGGRTINIELTFTELPKVDGNLKLTLEYDVVADDNIVKASPVEDKGYLISNFLLKYTNPNTNTEESHAEQDKLYAKPTFVTIEKSLIGQDGQAITKENAPHKYNMKLTNEAGYSNEYLVAPGETVKTTLRKSDYTPVENDSIKPGKFTISESLQNKEGTALTDKSESKYKVTYSKDGTKIDGGVFDLAQGTDVALKVENKVAFIGVLNINLALKDHFNKDITDSSKVFTVTVSGKSGDSTVFPYTPEGAAEATVSEFKIAQKADGVQKELKLEKLPFGEYTLTVADENGFEIKSEPVTLSLENIEGTATITAKIKTNPVEVNKEWGDPKPTAFPQDLKVQAFGQIENNDPAPFTNSDGSNYEVALVDNGHEDKLGKATFNLPMVDKDGKTYKYSFKEVGEANGVVKIGKDSYSVVYDNDNKTITNTLKPEYTLTVEDTENEISELTAANGTDGKYKKDTEISFKVAPQEGKTVKVEKIVGQETETLTAGQDGKYSFTITADTKIKVTYEAEPPAPAVEKFALTLEPQDKITVENATSDNKYEKNTTITFTVAAEANKKAKVEKIVGQETETLTAGQDGKYSFKITADTKIKVTYAEEPPVVPAVDTKPLQDKIAEAKKVLEKDSTSDPAKELDKKVTEAENIIKIAQEQKEITDKVTDLDTAIKAVEELIAKKDAAKGEIDKLPNLKPEDKKEAKDKVEKAKTKGEVAKAVEEAKAKAEVPTPTPTPEPTPSYPRYDYNPFWNIYFGSTTNKTTTTPQPQTSVKIKLQSKLVIGSKEMIKSVDGVEQKVMMDIAPFIDSNRTMLPIRFVAEALGFKVEWDHATRTVTLTDKDNVVRIPVDTNKIIVNGNEYESDVKPVLKDNRTMLPIGNIARALGLVDGKDIIWDAATKEVVIKREIEK